MVLKMTGTLVRDIVIETKWRRSAVPLETIHRLLSCLNMMSMTDFCAASKPRRRMIDSGPLFDIERQSCLAELRPTFAPVSCFIGHTTWKFSQIFSEISGHERTYSCFCFTFYLQYFIFRFLRMSLLLL